MNKKQKGICCVACVLLCCTLFNAPWRVRDSSDPPADKPVRYAPVWEPPVDDYVQITLRTDSLLMEWLGIAAITGLLILVFKSQKKPSE
jgi:hypothetical protein